MLLLCPALLGRVVKAKEIGRALVGYFKTFLEEMPEGIICLIEQTSACFREISGSHLLSDLSDGH